MKKSELSKLIDIKVEEAKAEPALKELVRKLLEIELDNWRGGDSSKSRFRDLYEQEIERQIKK